MIYFCWASCPAVGLKDNASVKDVLASVLICDTLIVIGYLDIQGRREVLRLVFAEFVDVCCKVNYRTSWMLILPLF